MKALKPVVYWLVVVIVTVVGTLVSDTLVDRYHIALSVTSTVFAVALAIVFAAWWTSEKTLSVRDIRTTKRELFYWTTILFTFALISARGGNAFGSARSRGRALPQGT